DSGPGSLRDAIAIAAPDDTIAFSLPAPTTIILTSGELLIDKDLTISGPGADSLIVQRSKASGAAKFPVLHIAVGNFAITISRLTISNGYNDGVTGSGRGGGLDNESSGTVNVSECIFTGNQTYNDGGAVCNEARGTLTL